MQFWRLSRVIDETGLSKSTIYRMMRIGSFPKCHCYRDTSAGTFWLSKDVQQWKRQQLPLTDEFDEVLG